MASPNLENLSIHDEEEEGFTFDIEEEGDEQVDLKWCLVGRFLCNRPMHFKSMKIRMADLWRPVKGVTIKETKEGLLLFSFAHPLDMEAVLNGGPWTFDNNMLIVDRVQIGMQIENIPLFHADFWVQIHNLPAGFMQEKVGIRLGNYIGTFMEYDKNNNTSFWRQYMRVRVKIDVRQPLKKGQRVRDKDGAWCMVNFKYEKLGVFCFVCGIMGHAENKCEVRFAMENDDGRREWSGDLRADQRRGGGRQTSRWLREDREGGNGLTGDEGRRRESSTVEIPTMGPITADVSTVAQDQPRHLHHDGVIINGPLISSSCHAANFAANLPNHDVADKNKPGIENHINCNQPVSRQALLLTETDRQKHSSDIPLPSYTVTDLPPLYGQSLPNHSHPYQLTIPTDLINKSSLSNNYPTFTTQSKQTAPTKQKTRKEPNTIKAQPAKKPTRPDPYTNQTYPNFNLTNTTATTTRTELGPVIPNPTRDSAVDMDSHTEKKRRREEKRQADNNDEESNQHFLSAGPGSQDCREQ
jgi:hypothetical protein